MPLYGERSVANLTFLGAQPLFDPVLICLIEQHPGLKLPAQMIDMIGWPVR